MYLCRDALEGSLEGIGVGMDTADYLFDA